MWRLLPAVVFLLPFFLAATSVYPSIFDGSLDNGLNFNFSLPTFEASEYVDNGLFGGTVGESGGETGQTGGGGGGGESGGQTGGTVGGGGGTRIGGHHGGKGGGRRRSPTSNRDFVTNYKGQWELVSSETGVSAMHLALTHKNKAIIFDATNFGDSKLALPAGQPCRFDQRTKAKDCSAHALEFDVDSSKIRALRIETNPWCASGGFAPDGTLVQTGGWWEGGNAVRYLETCEDCDWTEYPKDLAGKRWYATQQILPDGRFIVIGGRRQFNYEYVPTPGKPNRGTTSLPFLSQTNNPDVEDNLYPFVHLSTDGNLFIFANNKAILFDYKKNAVVREFPELPGGARSYPSSGMSAMLPLNLNRRFNAITEIPVEVIVCGGAPPLAAMQAGKGTFEDCINDCARIDITSPNPVWTTELMPKPRIMADLLNLPTGDLLFVNGAAKGAAGWSFARDPVFEPWLYQPQLPKDQRFKVLNPSVIPRMYHSSSAVLPDGKILVAGSNPNNGYNFTGVMYTTELRIEKFSPPYLDPILSLHRPEITTAADKIKYGEIFKIEFKLSEPIAMPSDLKVTMYAPPFTTHGYSMNQRLLILKTGTVEAGKGSHQIVVTVPPSAVLAPPGYYVVYLVHRGVPSKGVWVHIQ